MKTKINHQTTRENCYNDDNSTNNSQNKNNTTPSLNPSILERFKTGITVSSGQNVNETLHVNYDSDSESDTDDNKQENGQ